MKDALSGPRVPGDLRISLVFLGFSLVFFVFRAPGVLIVRPYGKIRTVLSNLRVREAGLSSQGPDKK